MLLFLIILSFITPPIGIPILIVYFLTHKKGNHPSQNKNWYMQIAFSKEDAVSQWFLLLSVFFLAVTLLALNRDFGDPLSRETILFLTSVIGLIIAYYFKAVTTLIFSLIGIVSWWVMQAMQWTQNKDIKSSSIFAGLGFVALLLYILGQYHEKILKYKRFAFIYTIFGIIWVTGTLFVFSSKTGLILLAGMTKGTLFAGSWEITVSLLLFFTAFGGLATYLAGKNLMLPVETAAVYILAVLFGIMAFIPEQTIFVNTGNYSGSGSVLTQSGVLWAIVFNFAIFFELLGLIFSGYKKHEEWLINIGTLFLFILIITKYFDWFFTFLDKSLFFISAGILLFAVGWFMEKSRRHMISSIKTGQQKKLKL